MLSLFYILHKSQQDTLGLLSLLVFTGRCLVAASNGGRSLSSVFPNCPRSQLPPSHSNSSQPLNPSGSLTHSLTHQKTTGLSCLHLGTYRVESIIYLMQCNCCACVCWADHTIATQSLPSKGLCLQSHHLATAVV
jgi:hypothetical protein